MSMLTNSAGRRSGILRRCRPGDPVRLLCDTMGYGELSLEAPFLRGGYHGGDHLGGGLSGRLQQLHVIECWLQAVRVPADHADADPDGRRDLTCASGDGVRVECRREFDVGGVEFPVPIEA